MTEPLIRNEEPTLPSLETVLDKRRKKYLDIAMIVLLVVAAGSLMYVGWNVHYIVTDPCQYCMEQTGAQCFRGFQAIVP